ncbi:hypothetical protein [Lysobacter gummosus]|uniref:hypothetical protein n=1 Tax=Lysobacter gummosus TaxID=262324 RepID=UPI00362D665E
MIMLEVSRKPNDPRSKQPDLLTPYYRHSRERGNPVSFVRERLKSLDSRVRGNDEQKKPQARARARARAKARSNA